MARSNEVLGSDVNSIISGTVIEGQILANGNMRIEGTVKGTVNVKGKLVLGETGVIVGEINCQNADISGNIEAKINVEELLHLKSTAKCVGDIYTNKLAIDPGAVFTGTCSMGGVMKDIKDGKGGNKKIEKTA